MVNFFNIQKWIKKSINCKLLENAPIFYRYIEISHKISDCMEIVESWLMDWRGFRGDLGEFWSNFEKNWRFSGKNLKFWNKFDDSRSFLDLGAFSGEKVDFLGKRSNLWKGGRIYGKVKIDFSDSLGYFSNVLKEKSPFWAENNEEVYFSAIGGLFPDHFWPTF